MYKLQHIMQSIFRHFHKIFIIAVFLLVSSCTQFRGPKYPEIIYNNKQPLVSMTYEYGEVQIILPLQYESTVPENILFKVYAKADTLNPLISILQEAPDEFRTTVPQGALDINSKTNLIKIIPQDENFDPVAVRFKGIGFGRIVLPTKIIRAGQLIVSGKTCLNDGGTILSRVKISLQNFDNIIYSTYSNDSGFFQIAIPGEYRLAEHLRIVAGENYIFKPFSNKLVFDGFRKLKIDIPLGPTSQMKGPLYITNKNNVQFKEGPDIGSKILFLLNKGEVLSADRVTPGSYYGYIEVEIEDRKKITMHGWVNKSDLRELNMNQIKNN